MHWLRKLDTLPALPVVVLEAAVEVAGDDAMGSWQAHGVAAAQHFRDRLQRSRIRSACILLALTTL